MNPPPPVKRRFKPLDIALAMVLAGWVPSILMAVVSYSILTRTLESKMVVDRGTLVQTLSRLLGSEFMRTAEVLEYYQALPSVQRLVLRPPGDQTLQAWLGESFYSHPRLDGMFLTDAAGRLLASVPPSEETIGQPFAPEQWLEGTSKRAGCYVSAVTPRIPDHRLATYTAVAIRSSSGEIAGYLGATILVERLGKRISGFEFGEASVAQVIDQNGYPLFTRDYAPTSDPNPSSSNDLLKTLRDSASGFFRLNETIYTHGEIEGTDWTAVLEQPVAVAYRPVTDLLKRTVALAVWLIVGTGVAAWLVSRMYGRQISADEEIARGTFFSEKILANMTLGIALVEPETRRFLQVNDRFREMARELDNPPPDREIDDVSFNEIHLGLREAFDRVADSGVPFEAHEQRYTSKDGRLHFLTINLLQLQDAGQRFQGVLLLLADNTADVTIRQELIAANTAKDEFLALLSHELRNPLSPVITMVAELEKRLPDSPECARPLEIIRRNVELEARLIDDLLDITRISHGKLQLTPEIVNAHRLIQRALEICQKEIDSKKMKVITVLDAANHYIKGDPARVQQVFWNLIKNAVKFTPEGGRISIQSRNEGESKLLIEVSDNGIGIEPDRIDRIFKAFEQADGSITRRFGGLGLGLAISRAMVEAHGGTIKVHSAGKDQGTTFSIQLETVETPSEHAPVEQFASVVGQQIEDHILLVDDHEDTCLGMKMLLQRRGYRVAMANNVARALDLAAATKFDLVISDIGLPDASGFELMETLRARGDQTPAIAISGFGMESDIARSREAGFSNHLIKPVNVERLDELLRSTLGKD